MKQINTQRIELFESIGNLLEKKLSVKLSNFQINLARDTEPSQRYFFTKSNERVFLDDKQMDAIYNFFVEEFEQYGLGCCLTYNQICFGIIHLSTENLKIAYEELKK